MDIIVIKQALQKATKLKEVHLEIPDKDEHGDYATNIAMVLAQKKKKNPIQVGLKIKDKLLQDQKLTKLISKINVVPPGFINFWLSEESLGNVIHLVLEQKDKYGSTNLLKGKKYLLEHTSPDPIKTIHVGHLRNNFLGMSLSNIIKFLGAKVVLDYIDNDRGTHVNRAMWGYLTFGSKKSNKIVGLTTKQYIKKIMDYSLSDKQIKQIAKDKDWKVMLDVWNKNKKDWFIPNEFGLKSDKFDNSFYSLGQRSSELVEGVNNQIQEMLKTWENKDTKLRTLWKQVIDWSWEGYKDTFKRIGSQTDKIWKESEIFEQGKKWVKKGLEKGVFKKLKDGAVLTDLKKYNLPDTVIQKKDGTSVYHTQDLQLTYLKTKTYPSDMYIWDIGNDQKLYLQQLFAMCEQLGIVKKEKLYHLNFGYITLKGGAKMSSRYGSVINGDDLLDELKLKARKIIETSDPKLRGEMNEKEKDQLSEKVALAACKYGFLRYSRERDVVFSIDESLSLEGNSGPYLQYTYARIRSVLRKSRGDKKPKPKPRGVKKYGVKQKIVIRAGEPVQPSKPFIKRNKEELILMRSLIHYPEIVMQAAINYAPNLICNYLFDLASKYNTFYNQHRILNLRNNKNNPGMEKAIMVFRLILTTATGQVLENGLKLLGIEAPERM